MDDGAHGWQLVGGLGVVYCVVFDMDDHAAKRPRVAT